MSENKSSKSGDKSTRELLSGLDAIVESVNSGITANTLDDVGNVHYIFANNNYYAMLGYTKQQFDAEVKNAFELVLDEDRDRIMLAVTEIIENSTTGSYEYRCRKRDGSILHVCCNASVVKIDGIDDAVLLSVTNDISELSNARYEALKAGEQIEAIMNNTNNGITAVIIGSSGNASFIFANDKYRELLGYTKEQYEKEVDNPFSLVHPDDIKRITAKSRETNESGTTTVEKFRAIKRDGSTIWLRDIITNLKMASYENLVQLSFFTDITEERLKEQKLKEADERLKFLNETAHDLLLQADAESGIERMLKKLLAYFDANRAFIYEYNPELGIISNTYELCEYGTPSKKRELSAFAYETLSYWFKHFKDNSFLRIDNTLTLPKARKDESALYTKCGASSVLALPLRTDGDIKGFMGIYNSAHKAEEFESLGALGDYLAVILARRDLNSKIENDNNMLLRLMNDTPGGFARLKIDLQGIGALDYANEGLCKLMGVSYRELTNTCKKMSFVNLIHPDDIKNVMGKHKDLSRGEDSFSVKCRLRHGKSGYISVMIFGRFTGSNRKDGYVNLYFTDISKEAKLDEQRIELVENLPCGAGVYELTKNSAKLLYLNKSFRELMSRTLDGKNDFDVMSVIHPDDRVLLMNIINEGIEKKKVLEKELRILNIPLNEYFYFRLSGNILEDDGKVIAYIIFNRISKEELSYRNMLPTALAAMMSSTTDISFVKDLNFKYICCSRGYAKICGLKSEKDCVGKTDYEIHGKTLADKFREADAKIYATGESMIDIVDDLPVTDGSSRYLNVSKYVLKDSFGNIIGLYGIGRDITESRKAYAHLKLITDNIPGGIAMYEWDGKTVKAKYVSDGLCAIMGYSPKEYNELVKENAACLVFDEDTENLISSLEALSKSRSSAECILRVHTKDGGYKWLSVRGVLVEKRGKIDIINAVMIDITESKNAEIKLKTSHDAMEIASKASDVSFWLYDIDKKVAYREFQEESPAGYNGTATNVPDNFFLNNEIHPDDEGAFRDMYLELESDAKQSECTVRIFNYVTEKFEWHHIIYTRLESHDGKERKAIGFSSNVDLQQENMQRYEHELHLRRELVRNSLFYYQVNLTTKTVEEYSSKTAYMPGIRTNIKIDENLRGLILSQIAPEYTEKVRNTIFSDALLKAYSEGQTSVSLVYRRHVRDSGYHWVNSVAAIMEKPGSDEVVAFLHCKDIDVEYKDSIAIENIMDEEIECVSVLNVKSGLAHFAQVSSDFDGLSAHQIFNYNYMFRNVVLPNVVAEDAAAVGEFFDSDVLSERLEIENPLKITYRVTDKDGQVHRKNTRAFFLDETHDEVVLIRRDITDLYEEEQRQKLMLEKAVDDANNANSAKSEFLSRMSHDMRTPLNAVLSFSSKELINSADKTELTEYLERIHFSGEYLLGIINDVLDMSKIEQNKMALNLSPYSLTEFENSIETVIGELAKSKGVQFIFNSKNATIPIVLVDKVRFNQIFVNLLSNAVKFTPVGGKVEFIVAYLPNGKKSNSNIAHTRYFIRDNGIGMSQDFLPHAFDNFSQEYRKNISEKNQGTGLGLSIVKKLVDMMGGTIEVESTLGKGTTFIVDIPVEIAPTSPAEIKKKRIDNISLEGMRVLICEDNYVNTEIVLRLLKIKGCIVESAENGKEGYEKFKASPIGYYDVILMDIRMPVMNGIDATRAIRDCDRPDSRTVPIIALTADAFDTDQQTSLKSGMNAHISKPIKPAVLYNALKETKANEGIKL